MGAIFLFLILHLQAQPIRLAVGMAETQSAPNVIRIAVGNSKIAKVKAVPPNHFWITGLKVGNTSVTTWDSLGHERQFEVRVLSDDAFFVNSNHTDVVKIALEFIELDTRASSQLGIRWPDSVQFGGKASYSSELSGLNYMGQLVTAKGMIQHLMHEGTAKMIANPDLYVRLGELATFHSGGEFPVSMAVESFGGIRKQIQWKPYGLTVKVTPKSPDRRMISSDISAEISELDPNFMIEGVPALTKRNVNTKMKSIDGETVIISGLIRRKSADGKTGLPLLSQIPLIGGLLFGTTEKQHEEMELFMSITLSFQNSHSVPSR